MKSSLPINKDDPQQQAKKVSRIEYIVKIFLLLFVFTATFGTLFLFLQNRKQLPKIENGEGDGALVPYDR